MRRRRDTAASPGTTTLGHPLAQAGYRDCIAGKAPRRGLKPGMQQQYDQGFAAGEIIVEDRKLMMGVPSPRLPPTRIRG
jgi:hypothetical protein